MKLGANLPAALADIINGILSAHVSDTALWGHRAQSSTIDPYYDLLCLSKN